MKLQRLSLAMFVTSIITVSPQLFAPTRAQTASTTKADKMAASSGDPAAKEAAKVKAIAPPKKTVANSEAIKPAPVVAGENASAATASKIIVPAAKNSAAAGRPGSVEKPTAVIPEKKLEKASAASLETSEKSGQTNIKEQSKLKTTQSNKNNANEKGEPGKNERNALAKTKDKAPTSALGSAKSETKTAKDAGDSAGKKDQSKASGKAAKPVVTVRKHGGGNELIPPPPPVQPSLLIGPDFGQMEFGIEGLSKEEIAKRSRDIGQQLTDMQDVLKEKQALATEAKDKAARFKPLFEEGVVSRHELEAAEKEAVDADRELERINRRVSEFQAQKQSVDGRLSSFNKKVSSSFKSPQPHKKKH